MRRQPEAVEQMDLPDCDPQLLERTYRQFWLVNRVVSGWRSLYLQRIRPLLPAGGPASILDIGCGGGDITTALARWAHADGLQIRVLGIDADERAYRYAAQHAGHRDLPAGALEFRQAYSHELLAEPGRFDVVVSNHLLHHLDGQQLQGLWQDSASLARHLALHADIRRSRLALALFGAGTLPLAGSSFIRRDGLASIRRSFSHVELARQLPAGWRAETAAPFRNLAVYQPEAPHEA